MMLAFAMMALAPYTDATEWELKSELARFPPLPRCSAFWTNHEEWLKNQSELYGYRLESVWDELWLFGRYKHCWELLRQARDNPYHEDVPVRLGYLKELRFLIGDEAYLMGWMPSFTPYWYFQPID